MIDLELCCESYDEALIAEKYQFKRIELCADLLEGGTTPSFGMIKKCSSIHSLETHAMIRPRGGDFVYSENELSIMADDIVAAKSAGAKGVVFGCLNKNQELNLKSNLYLCEVALKLNLEITFHRAFDLIENWSEALVSVQNLGFTRILTSGSKTNVNDGLNHLKLLCQNKNQLQIMAGGGVNHLNVSTLKKINLNALHFTARKLKINSSQNNMGCSYLPDENKIENILKEF